VPLRRRVAFAAALAVGVAVLAVAITSYLIVRGQLRGEVESELTAQHLRVDQIGSRALGGNLPGISAGAGGPAPYQQVISQGGDVVRIGSAALPVTNADEAIANAGAGTLFRDVSVGGVRLRMLTFGVLGGAVQLARPLGPTDRVLSKLRLIMFLLLIGGVGVAAALGRVAARRVLAPLAEVARTAEVIGETEDLTRRIEVRADDEVGALASRFNGMLERLEQSRDALDESVRAQRQLVADASHELRTPVTSLRTNVEVLLLGGELSADERDRLLSDVVEQSEELSALVNDLIELARGDEPHGATEDVRLDRVVAGSLERARRNAPGVTFEGHLEPVVVEGVAARLERAVNNLLDNAARHSPHGGIVEITVNPGGVIVRDHGDGIDPVELPYVFDRFFRGEDARSAPGSGLGLAIVRQVAEQHRGAVSVVNAVGGGAEFTIALPGVAASEPVAV
jgi:two-component system sensor histidine kinase MprB